MFTSASGTTTEKVKSTLIMPRKANSGGLEGLRTPEI